MAIAPRGPSARPISMVEAISAPAVICPAATM